VKILLVEDEPRISEFVARGLAEQGFVVDIREDGLTGLEAALDESVDLMILDLNLPLLSGERILERLTVARPELPVIVLSAKDGIDDRVRNLRAGADDYVTKPFSFAELVARVNARLRTPVAEAAPVLAYGRVSLDLHRRLVHIDGNDADLTSREFALLEVLMNHPRQILSHAQLLAQVWGDQQAPGSNVIEVYIRHLRRKLARDAIETVRGAGYRFVG
jgi:DNA-binding response OmpR family regulator